MTNDHRRTLKSIKTLEAMILLKRERVKLINMALKKPTQQHRRACADWNSWEFSRTRAQRTNETRASVLRSVHRGRNVLLRTCCCVLLTLIHVQQFPLFSICKLPKDEDTLWHQSELPVGLQTQPQYFNTVLPDIYDFICFPHKGSPAAFSHNTCKCLIILSDY